jgi:hypothetical protein
MEEAAMERFARSARAALCAGAIAVLVTACSSGGSSESPAAPAASPAGPGTTGALSGSTGTSGAPAGTPGGGVQVPGVPAVGPSIVKTASLSLDVGRNGFQKAADRATTIAAEQGGYVESSTSQGSDIRSGRLTLRVPVDHFEAALSGVSALGEVKLRSVGGKDVTSRFVDLDARIRNARAQESVLLGILHDATTVTATLQVQRTLSDVQLQIEELVGQERSLRNRADLGTIVLELFERVPPVHHTVATAGISNPQLSEAWTRAKATFFGLLYGLVVSAGVLVPLGLVAIAGLFVARRLRERRVAPEPRPEA